MIDEAFHQICKDAVKPEGWFLILMEKISFYGGPEEGGWWGNDNVIIAYHKFDSEELANKAKIEVQKLVDQMTADAQKSYGYHCNRQLDWLDDRGLDSDYLRENDGPSNYYLVVDQEIPEPQHQNRQYE